MKTHLYSYDMKNVIENININNKETDEKLYINSVDEYINIEFKPDNNIKNSFLIEPIEDQFIRNILKKSFIIGIFKNDTINNEKLPLINFFYVKKENFLTKNNYSLI